MIISINFIQANGFTVSIKLPEKKVAYLNTEKDLCFLC